MSLLHNPDAGGLWFFWDLGFIALLMYAVQAIALKVKKPVTVVAILLWLTVIMVTHLFPIGWFHIGSILHFFVFVYLGYEMHKVEGRIAIPNICRVLFPIVLVIGFAACFVVSVTFSSAAVRLTEILGAIACLVVFKCLPRKQGRLSDIGCAIGRRTMGIYAAHWSIFPFLAVIPYFKCAELPMLIVITVASYYVTVRLSRIPVARYLLLGIGKK